MFWPGQKMRSKIPSARARKSRPVPITELALNCQLVGTTFSPLTNFARVWSLARVNSHVDGQLASLVEPGTALVATVRFVLLVLSVGSHVIPDVALERLATDVAFVKPLVFVERQDVTLQRVRTWIGLVA